MARIIRIIRIKLFANNYSHTNYLHREYSRIIPRPNSQQSRDLSKSRLFGRYTTIDFGKISDGHVYSEVQSTIF